MNYEDIDPNWHYSTWEEERDCRPGWWSGFKGAGGFYFITGLIMLVLLYPVGNVILAAFAGMTVAVSLTTFRYESRDIIVHRITVDGVDMGCRR